MKRWSRSNKFNTRSRMLPLIGTMIAALPVACLVAAPAFGSSTATQLEDPPITIVADNDREDITPRMTIRGEAELLKPADQLRLNITVVSEGRDATETLDENSDRVEEVVKALHKAGLTEDEYETGRFTVQPKYSRRPRDLRGETEWTPQIVGYKVANTIAVKTKQLGLAGPLIQKANEAGANQVDGIRFELSDERRYRAEAIAQAATYAKEDAMILAAASGVEIVRVLSVSLDDARARTDQMRFSGMRAAGAMESSSSPTITPGEVTVTAKVTITYEIKDRTDG